MTDKIAVSVMLTRALEVLRRRYSKTKNAKPHSWTTGANARRRNGVRTSSTDSTAVCFCSLGAINRAFCELESEYSDAPVPFFNEVCSPLVEAIGNLSIPYWNDDRGRTFEEVETAFEEAIKIAKVRTP